MQVFTITFPPKFPNTTFIIVMCVCIYIYFLSFNNSVHCSLWFVQVVQATHVVEEWVDHAHSQLKDEEACQVFVFMAQTTTEEKCEDLVLKLTEIERERKSAETSSTRAKKQAKEQRLYIQKAEEQLTIACENIDAQQKELEGKAEEVAKAEQAQYDLGQKEMEVILRSQVTKVC